MRARTSIRWAACSMNSSWSPPFTGPPSAVAIAHVAQPPPPIEGVEEEPPPQIHAIIEDLLCKDPLGRTPYAANLCALLEDYGIATTAAGQPLPDTRPYLYSPKIVGFDAELAKAKAAVNGIGRNDNPTLIQVTGPAGSGKSRFLLEVTGAAVQSTAHVHVVSAGGEEHRLPFASLADVLDNIVDLSLAGEWRPKGEYLWLARLEPRLQRHLSDVDRETFDDLLDVTPNSAGQAMVRAMAGALRDIAGNKPIVVVVESLDKLERGSRAVVDEILRRAESEPWLVVSTGLEPVEVQVEKSEHIELPTLDATAVESMTSQILGGEPVDSKAAEALSDASGGRPARLIDLMHTMLDLRLVQQDERGRWGGNEGESLNEAVTQLIALEAARPEHRIERLSEDVRRVAEFCSVFGRRPLMRDLMTLDVFDSGQVLNALSDLINSNILVESKIGVFNNDYKLEFASQEIRDALYNGMPEGHRAAMHRAAAELMSTRDDLQAFAHHLELAGSHKRAHQIWLEAAARAKQQFALEIHAKCIEGALRVADWLPAAEREALLTERFESICEVSATPVVQTESQGVLDAVKSPEYRCQVLAYYFHRMIFEANADALEHLIDEVKSLADSDVPRVAAMANVTLVAWHGHHDQRGEAVDAGRRAERISSLVDDVELKFKGTMALVNALFRTEELYECLDVAQRALVIAHASGEHRRIHEATGRVVAVKATQGHFAALRPMLTPVADYQRRAHLLPDLLSTLHNIGYGDFYIGRFDGVLETLDEIKAVRQKLGFERDEAANFAMRGLVISALGHLEEATESGLRAIEVARTPWVRIHAELQFCEVLQLAGEFQESLTFLDSLATADWSDDHLRVQHALAAKASVSTRNFERAQRELAQAMSGKTTIAERAIFQIEEARLDLGLGNLEVAREKLEQLLKWFDAHEMRYDETVIRIALVDCLRALGEPVPDDLLEPARHYIESQPFLVSSHIRRELRRVS